MTRRCIIFMSIYIQQGKYNECIFICMYTVVENFMHALSLPSKSFATDAVYCLILGISRGMMGRRNIK